MIFAKSVKEKDSPNMGKEAFSEESVDAEHSQSKNRLELSLQELDRLIEIAEDKIPANPRSPQNQKHRRAFQRAMERYFQNLETAFPYRKVERIYKRYVTED